eukprot:SAG11_NODE_288_length_11198_cov_29.339130_9_plen_70_part_00
MGSLKEGARGDLGRGVLASEGGGRWMAGSDHRVAQPRLDNTISARRRPRLTVAADLQGMMKLPIPAPIE